MYSLSEAGAPEMHCPNADPNVSDVYPIVGAHLAQLG